MIKALTPIICACLIAAMVMFAVANDINGAVLASGATIIGGLGGYSAKLLKDHFTKPK